MRRRQRILLGMALFAIAFAYVWWIAGDLFSLGADEGIYLEGGRRVAAGQAVYRDFFVLTGPLTFWIEGGLARWVGTDIPLLRLPVLLEVAFLAWAVYWLATQFESQWFAAGLSLVFLAFESNLQHFVVKHRWDSAALATAAVLAAVAAHRRGSRRLWLLSGALGAAAAWATPSVGWVAVPLLVWAARRGLASALACLAGGVAVTAAAAGYLAANHALGPMVQALRWTAANYTQANALPYGYLGSAPGAAAAAGLLRLAVRLAASAFESLPAVLPVAARALRGIPAAGGHFRLAEDRGGLRLYRVFDARRLHARDARGRRIPGAVRTAHPARRFALRFPLPAGALPVARRAQPDPLSLPAAGHDDGRRRAPSHRGSGSRPPALGGAGGQCAGGRAGGLAAKRSLAHRHGSHAPVSAHALSGGGADQRKVGCISTGPERN